MKVLCIDAEETDYELTKGKVYKVYRESNSMYFLTENDPYGDYGWYKYRFVVLNTILNKQIKIL